MHAELYIDQLNRLEVGTRELEPSDYAELAHLAPIERARSSRFFLESYDPSTDESSRGQEVKWSEVQNHARDFVLLADGTETSPMIAIHQAIAAMRVRSQLELSVGPFVRSRGPGPFMPVPTCGQPFVDPAWNLLELCRVDLDSLQDHVPWWFVSGSRTNEALADLAHVRPENESVEQWPRCRDRYRALLEEAKSAGDAVVFTQWLPDDLGQPSAFFGAGTRILRPE